MCNPCGIPDAKFFGERKRRRKKPQRTEPLPGTKQTLSSEDDGVLEQMFTAHDSTTIPKPQGGRKLVLRKDDGQLKEIVESQTRRTGSGFTFKTMNWLLLGLVVFLAFVAYCLMGGWF